MGENEWIPSPLRFMQINAKTSVCFRIAILVPLTVRIFATYVWIKLCAFYENNDGESYKNFIKQILYGLLLLATIVEAISLAVFAIINPNFERQCKFFLPKKKLYFINFIYL